MVSGPTAPFPEDLAKRDILLVDEGKRAAASLSGLLGVDYWTYVHHLSSIVDMK